GGPPADSLESAPAPAPDNDSETAAQEAALTDRSPAGALSDSEHSPDQANGSQPLADPPPDQTGDLPPVGDADIHPSLVTTPAVRPPGAGTFSLEGRAAPGLYLVAWLASVLG